MHKMENFDRHEQIAPASREIGRHSIQKPIFAPSEGRRVYSLLLLFSFICTIICFFFAAVKEDEFVPVAILPAAWFLLLCINFPLKKHISYISLLVISAALSCRYCLYPVAVMLDIASSRSLAYDMEAVMMMMSELVGANLIIAFFARKLSIPETKKDTSGKIGIISGFLLFIAVICALAFPDLLVRFSISRDAVRETAAPHIVQGFYQMGSWVMIVFFLTKLSRLKASSKGLLYLFSAALAALFCLQYIASSIFASGSVSRWAIISGCISLGYVFLTLFPKNKKWMVSLISIGMVAGIFYVTFLKFEQKASVEAFRDDYLLSVRTLDDYFAGVDNIRAGLNAIENHHELQSVSAVATTIFMNMPVVSGFFPNATKTDVVSYYNRYVHVTYKICPLVVQSVALFGKLGSCILAMIFTYLAFYFNVLCKRTENLTLVFVFLGAVFFCGIFVCLNTRIILVTIWLRILFFLFMKLEEILRSTLVRR